MTVPYSPMLSAGKMLTTFLVAIPTTHALFKKLPDTIPDYYGDVLMIFNFKVHPRSNCAQGLQEMQEIIKNIRPLCRLPYIFLVGVFSLEWAIWKRYLDSPRKLEGFLRPNRDITSKESYWALKNIANMVKNEVKEFNRNVKDPRELMAIPL